LNNNDIFVVPYWPFRRLVNVIIIQKNFNPISDAALEGYFTIYGRFYRRHVGILFRAIIIKMFEADTIVQRRIPVWYYRFTFDTRCLSWQRQLCRCVYPHRLFVPDRTGAIFGGIEHGHIHKPSHEHIAFPLGILVSLCIHAFLEGMPLAEGNQNQLVYGIALHHVPAAFALATVLLANKQTKGLKRYFSFVLFAIMAPAGYFFMMN